MPLAMNATFIESREFTHWITRYLPDETYAVLQQELMNNPRKGDVMPGCGGLRKIRVSDPRRGSGKRGGTRVIYLYIPDTKQFYLLDIYAKDEQADLSAAEKRSLSKLANELKRQARDAHRSHRGGE